MRVIHIIAPAYSEQVLAQRDFFLRRGEDCRLHVQVDQIVFDLTGQAADEEPLDGLYIFHYTGIDYPALHQMRYLHQGVVILDTCDAADLQDAPAHYADICLVATASHARFLQNVKGCPRERVFVLSGMDGDTFWDAVLQWASGALLSWRGESNDQTDDKVEEVLLIRDPSINKDAIFQRLRQMINQRRLSRGYGSAVASLGPSLSHPDTFADGNSDEPDRWLILYDWVEELAARSHFQEPQFHSRVPVIAPLIVAVRRFWNWMSTKWYVRGWMGQQLDFNVQLVEVMQGLVEALESSEQRIRELEQQIELLSKACKGEVDPE